MNKQILVVGSLNMDLVANVSELPKKGETVFGKTFTTYPGGKGANQAVAAAKLDAKVAMVGCVGNDSFGEQLLNGLKVAGVDISCIRTVNTSSGTALITVNDNGANTIVVISGANKECSPSDVTAALDKFIEPGILLVQHEVSEETTEFSIIEAKKRGWIVVLNPAPARPVSKEALSCVDILTPNETEASVLSGIEVISLSTAKEAAEKLLNCNVDTVVITLGDKGALAVKKDQEYLVEAFKVKAVDTVAAGDSFTGALAAALAEGMDLEKSLRFAAKAAAISVTRAGAQSALPIRYEVDHFSEDD